MTWIQIGVEKIHKETKYVLFLDDDVRLHPGSIGALTLEMEKNPEVCIEIFILFTLYIWAILISSFPSDNLLVVRGPLFYVCGLYIFSVFLLCCRYSFRLDTHLIYPLGVWGVTVYMNTIWYEVFTITRSSFFFFCLGFKNLDRHLTSHKEMIHLTLAVFPVYYLSFFIQLHIFIISCSRLLMICYSFFIREKWHWNDIIFWCYTNIVVLMSVTILHFVLLPYGMNFIHLLFLWIYVVSKNMKNY